MPMIAHVFRRGAVYAWRRRIPARAGNASKSSYIQVSLHTHDPTKARALGAVLHAASERAFELMAVSRLTALQARKWFEHVVNKELEAIDNRRLAEHDDTSGGGYDDNRLLDELVAHCFRLLARQGKSATFDPTRDQALAAREFTDEEIDRGNYLLDIYRQDFWSEARYGKTTREAKHVLDQDEISSLDFMELRRIQMEGKAVAYSASLKPDDGRLDDAIAVASAIIERREKERREIFVEGLPAASEEASSGISQSILVSDNLPAHKEQSPVMYEGGYSVLISAER